MSPILPNLNKWISSRLGVLFTLGCLITGSSSFHAQLILTDVTPSATIDFSNGMQASVGTSPASAYTGAGFDASPSTSGRLNSNAWAVTGWSDGALAFGGTRTTAATDYTRGSTAIAVTTGGFYAFTGSPGSAANPTLMIQQGGSDFEPGTLTLRIQNNGATAITELAVSYNLYVRNDQGRSSSFNFSHSSDGSAFTAISALNYNSPGASDADGWVLVGSSPSRSTTITVLNIAPSAYYYLRWTGAQGETPGIGSRDELGLDDIAVIATYAPTTPTKLAITSISPATVFAGSAFSVTVQSQSVSSAAANVTADTDVVISVDTGTGVLGGVLTGTILAGTNSIVLTGITYSIPENGVVLEAERTSGDVLTSGFSAPFDVLEPATKLAITAINGGAAVFSGVPFSVTVQSRQSDDSPQAVFADTDVELSVNTGAGTLSGTFTGTILAGQHTATITGVVYSAYETGVILEVERTAGDLLAPGVSSPFNVLQGLAVGDVTVLAYNSNTPDQGFAFVNWVALANGTVIKFTDCGWNNTSTNAVGAARASEQTVVWTNTTGNAIPTGTVIRIVNLTATQGTASAGASTGLSGIATVGDQIIAYQGPVNTGTYPDYTTTGTTGTFAGRVIYGLTYGTSGWRTTGTADANTSYLPSHLNVTNGNIAITGASVPRDAQYTGTRNGFADFNDYKTAVNNPANWTLNITTTAITIDLTPFTLATGSASTLAITQVNGGLNPSANVPFSIEVQSWDNSDDPAPVSVDTQVQVDVFTGTGNLAGTLTGTISAGSSNVFVGPMTYDLIEAGVVLEASVVSGDALSEGQSAVFDVVGGAIQLDFHNLPPFQYYQNNVPTFQVRALRSDNTVDTQYSGPVTVSMISGLGALTGTLTQNATNGVATFPGLFFTQVGVKVLRATSGALTDAISQPITVSFAYFTETIMPQYMQGLNGTNNNRIPVAFRAVLQGLIPNTTYKYFNLAVDEDSSPTINGAGVPVFVSASGFTRSATPTFSLLGSYGEFTTSSTGAYTGWFALEASANEIFTPGNDVFMRIVLNDGAGGTAVALRITSSQSIRVLNFAGAEEGTALRGTSFATPRNFVVAYDNVAGSGRPVSVAIVEDDLMTAPASYANFYRTQVDGIAGSWGMIIPNNLPTGIRRLEQRRSDNGQRVDCGNLDGDGVWPSGANTVNPTSGATAIHITQTDAALQLSQPAVSITANLTSICPGNSVTLSVNGGSVHQGGVWRWFNGSCGTGGFNTGTSITVSPSVTTTYYVRAETNCHQTTCASITIVVGNCPFNDLIQFAPNVVPQLFGTCTNVNGNLTTATPSPESNSPATTGEDVWYRFTANSVGIRIAVTAVLFDAIIELKDGLGNTLAFENALSGPGGEIMHYYESSAPLINGQEYYVAVRNADSSQGTGPFSICIQRLRAPQCNAEPPYATCNQFKSMWVGASSYSFAFTNTNTLQVINYTSSNGITYAPLANLVPGETYQVDITANFTVTNGAGQPVNFSISRTNACTITLEPHPSVVLRDIDRCAAGSRGANAQIAANRWVCGAAFYEWRFKQTAPQQDVDFSSPYAGTPVNRFINLAPLALIPGATYDVQIRPVFPGNVPGQWGSSQCLHIIGPAEFIAWQGDAEANEQEHKLSDPEVLIYPNPTRGDRIVLSISGIASMVHVRVMDGTGREVHRQGWYAEGPVTRELVFEQPLSAGVYLVEVLTDSARVVQRIVVAK